MNTTRNNKNSGSRAGSKDRRSSANGTGTRSKTSGSNVRRSTPQRARMNTKRRKRSSYNYKLIAVIGVVLMMFITITAFAGRYLKDKGLKQEEAAATTQESKEEVKTDVSVDGVRITGLTKSDAKKALLQNYQWGMKVTYDGAEEDYEIPNLAESKVDDLLDEIYQGQPKENYTLDMTGLEEAVKKEVAVMAKQWDVPAQNGAISGFDKDTGSFIYSSEKSGRVINQEQLLKDISDALSGKQFQAVITASGTSVAPEITQAQAKEMYTVIGTMVTKTTGNKDRNTNIRLAAEALDGMIIPSGGEFSFNTTTGNRTLARGYKPAGAYVNGVLVEEPGGGVCQVSSTLYNAVVFSGLTTTERHAHSFEPNYIPAGEDAMVSYDGYAGPDMKFVNNSKDAVAIRAKFADQKLTISIVGIPILKDGEKLYMKSEKVSDLDPPEPNYEENQTLEPGVEKVVKEAKNGSRWKTNLVKEINGAIVSDEFLHRSSYKGKAATIQRNTSGVVIPAETQENTQEQVGIETHPPGNTGEQMPEGSEASEVPQESGPGLSNTTEEATDSSNNPPERETTMALPQGPGDNPGTTQIAPPPF